MRFRTDLAIENKEMYDSENKGKGIEISGVEVETEKFKDIVGITRIKITDENGSKAMQKPLGNYITLEVEGVVDGEEEIKEAAAAAVSNELKRLIQFHNKLKVLIIGLGNDKVTPDSLGPYTVSKVKVTRHYFLMYDADSDDEMSCVSGFIPGVMGSTGDGDSRFDQKRSQDRKTGGNHSYRFTGRKKCKPDQYNDPDQRYRNFAGRRDGQLQKTAEREDDWNQSDRHRRADGHRLENTDHGQPVRISERSERRRAIY